MLNALDMLDFIITQVKRRKVLQSLQVLNPMNKIIVEIEFDQSRRKIWIDTCDLIISETKFLNVSIQVNCYVHL
jgi:hypothetical protein